MPRPLVVVDRAGDWRAEYPDVPVATARDYLTGSEYAQAGDLLVINLCRSQRYQSIGYYCSLLAEARGHRVLPSVRTSQDLAGGSAFSPRDGLDARARRYLRGTGADRVEMDVYFGRSVEPGLANLAREVFNAFRSPLLRLDLRSDGSWRVHRVKALGVHRIPAGQRPAFVEAMEAYLTRRWRGEPRTRSRYRHDLAILVDASEKLPPSNRKAIERFIKAARRLGLDAETIGPRDLGRLPEYDALFIRATTQVNHYTYRFARRAEREGMVVIDDPASILRCTNKVYLTELLHRARVPVPASLVLSRERLDAAEAEVGYPMVLKVPDGSFSRGVFKAGNRAELERLAMEMFEHSELILAQAFTPTEFDWRVGILDHRPLYVSKYYMARRHWQIVKHGPHGRASAGAATTLPVDAAPRAVISTALKAARLIGDGLYGVDLKETEQGVRVIEVNDNPSLDAGIEDAALGDALYDTVMRSFGARLEG